MGRSNRGFNRGRRDLGLTARKKGQIRWLPRPFGFLWVLTDPTEQDFVGAADACNRDSVVGFGVGARGCRMGKQKNGTITFLY